MMLLRSFIPPLGMMLLAAGQAGAQRVLIDRSEIRFSARQSRNNVDGRFRKWKANIVFLPRDLKNSKAELEIDLSSIDLANDETEVEIKRAPWFNVDRFPTAHFESSAIRAIGNNRYEVSGTLTIKGTARQVAGPIVLKKDPAGNNVAEGTFTLSRADFGLGQSSLGENPNVASDVSVRLRMVLPPVK